jgi:rRNA processing protein Krr1/Pno1
MFGFHRQQQVLRVFGSGFPINRAVMRITQQQKVCDIVGKSWR